MDFVRIFDTKKGVGLDPTLFSVLPKKFSLEKSRFVWKKSLVEIRLYATLRFENLKYLGNFEAWVQTPVAYRKKWKGDAFSFVQLKRFESYSTRVYSHRSSRIAKARSKFARIHNFLYACCISKSSYEQYIYFGVLFGV